MFRQTNETEGLLLPITKNYETFSEQTHTKPQETLEFQLGKPMQKFLIRPLNILGSESTWIVGLTSLEVYISIPYNREQNHKFDLDKDLFDEF